MMNCFAKRLQSCQVKDMISGPLVCVVAGKVHVNREEQAGAGAVADRDREALPKQASYRRSAVGRLMRRCAHESNKTARQLRQYVNSIAVEQWFQPSVRHAQDSETLFCHQPYLKLQSSTQAQNVWKLLRNIRYSNCDFTYAVVHPAYYARYNSGINRSTIASRRCCSRIGQQPLSVGAAGSQAL